MTTKDLGETAGLPLSLGSDGRLEFSEGLPAVEPAVRRLGDMKEVLADPEAVGPEDLYFMYRAVGFPSGAERLRLAGLRYDVTVLAPGLVGAEFNKTAGHYHPTVPGSGTGYPEIYEVISGVAHYLIQRPDPAGSIEDVILIEARPGDRVLVPPGYGHVTINPGPGCLVMCNLVAGGFASVYEPYRGRRGAAYYEFKDGTRALFRPNLAYGEVPDLRLEAPNLRAHQPGPSLYQDAVGEPEAFRCLTEPHHFDFSEGNLWLKSQ